MAAQALALLSILLAFVSFARAVPLLGSSHTIRQTNTTSPLCTLKHGAVLPDLWSVHDLHINYSADSGVTPSNATFSLTTTKTNATEVLTCNLRLNYQCQFNGTPKEKNLQIWLQLNLAAYFTILHTEECEGGRTVSVGGKTEMEMSCSGDSLEDGMTCAGDDDAVYASGNVEVREGA